MQSPTPATEEELLDRLHPRLAKWFSKMFDDFTHVQLLCVPAVLDRQSILLTSPTGSGKTLAGFLGVFDFLLRKIDNKESMMLEDPSAALERIYHEMFARVETVTATPAPA